MKTILKITADEDGRIEIHIDAKNSMDPLTLVGLLEQIKQDLFRENQPERVAAPAKKYDA
jgi:hypothetical protein